ncbi:MAG: lipase, partial [Verrucomicrobiia bacterium]
SVGLDVLAEQVGDQISGCLQKDERFAVVAFSMGGLVTRWWLQELETDLRPALFVTASSPHHGTLTAYARFNAGARQMRPGSGFLKRINQSLVRLRDVRLVTLRTPWDLMILPSSSSILPGAENHLIPVIAHPLMLMDGRSIRLIHSLLDETFASPQR